MSFKIFSLIQVFIFSFCFDCLASVKQPEFAGQFYPAQKEELSILIDSFLEKVPPQPVSGEIFMLINPHAGYGYSGQSAAFGYKLIKNKSYKTVIIIGTSHHQAFNGAALYGQGSFVTSLGTINVDEEFVKSILGKDPEVFQADSAFSNEHSIEVQLPFLQKVLTDFTIVPVVIGDCSLESCKKIALLFKEAIGQRQDILVVVSTDLYHGYDFQEADIVDEFTLDLIKKMDYQGLYYALRDGKAQACGGFAAVVALNIAKELGMQRLEVLNHTNSARVTGKLVKGNWTVGYSSCAVMRQEGETMLTTQQKQKLLKIARESIGMYLESGKKLPVDESDLVLNQKMGAFVTLKQHNDLRGCIGNLIGSQPLYLTVRDMAIEAAVGDPRFQALSLSELKDIQIEISVLSPLEKVLSAEKIELGKHGVLVRRGNQSGVFLPQVATETGWSKEEFLNNLCAQKAGIAADAWKDKATQLYIFSAEVFSEKGAEKE
ncbi:MAG: AmmeMemoRadiSam system protein B [Candidatus Omnitrophica bacterium]|nr:AmmeMemoRadiSam system protein B [Candidatus Omnitrophota bacterium]MBU4303855.1 AmmeMemoRadiSam system protein B [Candidatus Omnitrophota bacterium]MBU4418348.1 AmmeMemoRadiSam system protein B [Candidatus Omnitrophota bacterium]MBU4467700.1 AmmeMemoRadiSam system protein B [Candidatus Omnitrophota bacterium]MCG2707436.1 AmmeMemoRadiSam system protein B [Candidatus Omnitrophota bacterium]